jgi:hypothetical protein
MCKLTIRELIELLEESIETGEINENSFIITLYNNHLGYITDWKQKGNKVEFITSYILE